MLTFPQFQQSKKWSDNVHAELNGHYGDDPVIPGFIYDDGHIEKHDDDYYLVIGREAWLDKDLTKLERILWSQWYLAELNDEEAHLRKDDGTLDDYIVGACDSYGIEVDGDAFAALFSGREEWLPEIVEGMMRAYLMERRRRILMGDYSNA